MKVLVICDDYWHPADVVRRGLSETRGFAFDFVEDAKDTLTPDMLCDYDVIMNTKGNYLTSANNTPWFDPNVTEVGPAEFENYVREGGGFLSVHSGNTFLPDSAPEMVAFVGCAFVKHPPRCDTRINVVASHPVTAGIESFVVRDEHYQVDHIAPDAKLLLETVSQTGGVQVGGYVREIGKGRLCALTPGHLVSVWKHPMYQKLLTNALNWCARKDC